MLVSEIRLDNLLNLVRQEKTIAAVAEKASASPAYLSQIINKAPSSTGTPRSVGNSLARKIEKGFGLANGWMDTRHEFKTPESSSTIHSSMIRLYQHLLNNHNLSVPEEKNIELYLANLLKIPPREIKSWHLNGIPVDYYADIELLIGCDTDYIKYGTVKQEDISNKAQSTTPDYAAKPSDENSPVHDSALSKIFDSDTLESIQQLNASEMQMLKNMINKFLKSDLFTRQALNIVISGAQEDAERTLEAKKLEQESRSITTDSQNEEHQKQKEINPSNSG